MSVESIRNIVIVGGGSAGWMTATALATVLRNNFGSITLIESEQIGTVSVGEATIPQILLFNRLVGLDENEFIRETQATFKLGIEFKDWRKKGHAYMHPFGSHGSDMEGIHFHHFWLKLFQAGKAPDLEAFSLTNIAAKQGRFSRPQDKGNSPLSQIAYAFHFDATLYAKYLRRISESRGVTRIEGKVADVVLNKETGFIDHLMLMDNRKVDGDLFIDCTGFRGLLIEKALNVGFKDWSQWLPCDSAVAMPCLAKDPIYPYTRSTAQDAGWTWRIPLQHRIGNGYVYPSQFVSDDQAVETLTNAMENEPLRAPNQLRWKTGVREKFWEKNCIAVGLSAGFIEPLESTGLHLIQAAIVRLFGLFPERGFRQADIEAYNSQMHLELERIRDFIILHYKLTERDDTPFWEFCKNMPIPDYLRDKMALYKANGRIFRQDEELFDETSWLSVMHGQGLEPEGYHPLINALPDNELQSRVSHIQQVIANSVKHMPMHTDFINQFCKAKMPE